MLWQRAVLCKVMLRRVPCYGCAFCASHVAKHKTEGCKFSKLLELNFVLNFVYICRFPSFFVNFLRPSDVCVLKVYCNRGTSSCFHDAPREMKFLAFHHRITSILFSTSPHYLFLSHSHTHTPTHTPRASGC